jgi:hypothetical protein
MVDRKRFGCSQQAGERTMRASTIAAVILNVSAAAAQPPAAPTGCTETYCVDQANGNDSNPGTAARPFKNLTAVPALSDGQSVGLACETPPAHWRQQISRVTSGYDGTTFTGYGPCTSVASIIAGATSNLPIIDGADIISTGWSKTVGYANVYNTNSVLVFATACGGANTDYNFAACGGGPPYHSSNAFENVWEDDRSTITGGKLMVWEPSIANVDATPCSYYVPDLITTGSSDGYWAIPPTGTLFIHGCNAAALNPSANGYTYDYANREYSIGVGGSGVTMAYFESRKANWGNGMLTATTPNGASSYNNLIVRQYSETGLGATGGSSITNSLFIDGYFPGSTGYGGSATLIYENVVGATGKNAIIANNIIQQDQNIIGNNILPLITQIVGGGLEGTLNFNNNWIIGKNGFVTTFVEGPSWVRWSMTGDYWTNTNGIALADVPVTITSGTAYSPSVGTFAGLVTIQAGGSLTQSGNTLCSGSWCGPPIPNVR